MEQIVKIEWDDAYSIDDEHLDEQHRRWIGFYNQLEEAMGKQDQKDLAETRTLLLEQMSDYVAYHFQYEEEYMRGIGYPDVDKHWRAHKNFRNEIYRLYRDHQEGNIVLTSEIMSVLKNWILGHILEEDKKIQEFVRGREQE